MTEPSAPPSVPRKRGCRIISWQRRKPSLSEQLEEAAAADGVKVWFLGRGEAYTRARAVADVLGLDIQSYLLECLREGHLVLKARARQKAEEVDTDLEVPAILRRPPPQDPREYQIWRQVRALFD